MLFSSPIFLFLFLPVVLLGYYISPRIVKNYFLLFASLIFFAWGGVSYTVILIASIVANYFFGIMVQKHTDTRKGYWWLFAGVLTNLLLLGIFKYANFIVENINLLLNNFTEVNITEPGLPLPLGISFYTFHALSYLIDIRRKKANAQRNFIDLALYISMFSQLIAGPIIRYSDVWQQLNSRTHSLTKFAYGVERFIIGLSKKVLLANIFAKIADNIFSLDNDNMGSLNAWLGIICYTIQIYYDFAGYSDMAIGLGSMFGFEFNENFNFPYISKNITEFWRRWHISLSTWLHDYLFMPLSIRFRNWGLWGTLLSLNITFLLAGLWHGADWNFILFGLLNGLALSYDVVTKKLRKKISARVPTFIYSKISITLTLFYWLICLIFFRSVNIPNAFAYIQVMFSFKTLPAQTEAFMLNLNKEFYIALSFALLGAFGFFAFAEKYIQKILSSKTLFSKALSYPYHSVSAIVYLALFFMCTMYLISGTYNPFIYYRF